VNIVLLALMLVAPMAVADEEPRFLITRISVDGLRYASDGIVVSESRLRVNRSYSEAEFRDAMARIERLPFVLAAEFRLARGSEAGSYVLVIAIKETKPLFISARSGTGFFETLDVIPDPGPVGGEPTGHVERNFVNVRFDELTIGGRWFIGSKGVAHLAASLENRDRYTAGYTQYDLFGTRASLAALVTYRVTPFPSLGAGFVEDRVWKPRYDYTYDLLLAVPVSGNDSIRALWRWKTEAISDTAATPAHFVVTTRGLHVDDRELSWTHDTTNDPFFPTSGIRVSALIADREFADRGVPASRRFRVIHRTDYALTAERFWTWTPRQSVSVGIDATRAAPPDTYIPRIGYSASVWGRDSTIRRGTLRFEAGLSKVIASGTGPWRANAGFTFRNEWGILRIDAFYSGSL
jgi:hypothetical protein